MQAASETSDPALASVLERIHELNLARHLIDLTNYGYGVVPRAPYPKRRWPATPTTSASTPCSTASSPTAGRVKAPTTA